MCFFFSSINKIIRFSVHNSKNVLVSSSPQFTPFLHDILKCTILSERKIKRLAYNTGCCRGYVYATFPPKLQAVSCAFTSSFA